MGVVIKRLFKLLLVLGQVLDCWLFVISLWWVWVDFWLITGLFVDLRVRLFGLGFGLGFVWFVGFYF